jgi:hypothetical protein
MRHRARRTLRPALAAGCSLAALLAGTMVASAARDTVVTDERDSSGKLDLVRVSLGRGPDGRLRGLLTMEERWDGSDLVAGSASPGSICLRLWTVHDPSDGAPDFLVCVTARRDGRLSGSVLAARRGDFPRRAAKATVARPSARSVVVRFAQSSIARPARLRFAAETTRAGCARTTCVDTAPDAPATRRLVLRSSSRR